MRRWNLLVLVALLVVMLLAAVPITAAGARGPTFPSTRINFKGRIVAKNTDTHYFVLSFTCSGGSLSAGWTYEVNSTQSFTGTLDTTNPPSCALSSTNGAATWLQPSVNLLCVSCLPNPNPIVGTLTLALTDIVATKTFFPNTTNSATKGACPSTTSSPCIEVDTSDPLIGSLSGVAGFESQCSNFTCPMGFPNATLNLSVR